eukprot:m.269094 g.269094  ORF g.269094 m.269094 type:complete len:101 (-) comp54735_c0_seq14:195-497(-)
MRVSIPHTPSLSLSLCSGCAALHATRLQQAVRTALTFQQSKSASNGKLPQFSFSKRRNPSRRSPVIDMFVVVVVIIVVLVFAVVFLPEAPCPSPSASSLR